MAAVSALLIATAITSLFGWSLYGSVRLGRLRGIGWSVSRDEQPFVFAIYTGLMAIAGIIGLGFCVLLGWILLR